MWLMSNYKRREKKNKWGDVDITRPVERKKKFLGMEGGGFELRVRESKREIIKNEVPSRLNTSGRKEAF